MVGFSEFLVLGEIPFRIRAARIADARAPVGGMHEPLVERPR